jgi:hypothetical protein
MPLPRKTLTLSAAFLDLFYSAFFALLKKVSIFRFFALNNPSGFMAIDVNC